MKNHDGVAFDGGQGPRHDEVVALRARSSGGAGGGPSEPPTLAPFLRGLALVWRGLSAVMRKWISVWLTNPSKSWVFPLEGLPDDPTSACSPDLKEYAASWSESGPDEQYLARYVHVDPARGTFSVGLGSGHNHSFGWGTEKTVSAYVAYNIALSSFMGTYVNRGDNKVSCDWQAKVWLEDDLEPLQPLSEDNDETVHTPANGAWVYPNSTTEPNPNDSNKVQATVTITALGVKNGEPAQTISEASKEFFCRGADAKYFHNAYVETPRVTLQPGEAIGEVKIEVTLNAVVSSPNSGAALSLIEGAQCSLTPQPDDPQTYFCKIVRNRGPLKIRELELCWHRTK